MLLSLPMCPVYGVGGVLMSALLSGFGGNLLMLYALGAILASSVELAFFLLGQALFDVRLWDYRDKPYSFMGGVCGEYTLWWGLVAVVLVEYIDPLVSYALSALNPYTELTVSVFLAVAVLKDAAKTTSVLNMFKNGKIDKLPECFWYMQRIS